MGRLGTLLLALAVGCGRFDFDRVSDAVASDTSTGSFVISATRLVPAGAFSFVDVDVDWTRSLAYVATRQAGQCFQMIDFAGTPAIIASFGPPLTASSTCLGLSLDIDALHLVVTSFAGFVERWDLGDDPHAGAFVRQTSIGGVTNARRIRRDFVDPFRLYVPRGKDKPGFQVVIESATTPFLALGPAFDSAVACPDNDNDIVDLATGVALSGCSTDNAPLELVDDQTMALLGTIPAISPVQPSGFWAAARSPDGSLALALGWTTVVVATSGGGARYAMQARATTSATAYHDGAFIDRGNGLELLALADTTPTPQLDIISLVDPTQPTVVASAVITGVDKEAYAMKLAPDGTRAIVVTNSGWFAIVDPRQLVPANAPLQLY